MELADQINTAHQNSLLIFGMILGGQFNFLRLIFMNFQVEMMTIFCHLWSNASKGLGGCIWGAWGSEDQGTTQIKLLMLCGLFCDEEKSNSGIKIMENLDLIWKEDFRPLSWFLEERAASQSSKFPPLRVVKQQMTLSRGFISVYKEDCPAGSQNNNSDILTF